MNFCNIIYKKLLKADEIHEGMLSLQQFLSIFHERGKKAKLFRK